MSILAVEYLTGQEWEQWGENVEWNTAVDQKTAQKLFDEACTAWPSVPVRLVEVIKRVQEYREGM